MTKNYEQIRAKNALAAANDKAGFAGVKDGKAVAKKVPAQIIQNGFLGALAFAIETGHGYETVFKAIIAHLQSIGRVNGVRTGDLTQFMEDVCKKDADYLRSITDESLAYLNYLRRFAVS